MFFNHVIFSDGLAKFLNPKFYLSRQKRGILTSTGEELREEYEEIREEPEEECEGLFNMMGGLRNCN